MEKKLQESWKIYGRTYMNRSVGPTSIIPIKESTVLSGNIFGEPIDARLAISYIRDLWTKVNQKGLLDLPAKTAPVRELLSELVENKSDGFTAADWTELKGNLDVLDETIQVIDTWMKELLGRSFALTMRKSLILKILSQDECEGLRFYLCVKRVGQTEAGESPDELADLNLGEDLKLALVTVGVDKNLKDLHYDYFPEVHQTASANTVADVENISMCSEYPATAAAGLYLQSANSPALEPYTLFRYSKHP